MSPFFTQLYLELKHYRCKTQQENYYCFVKYGDWVSNGAIIGSSLPNQYGSSGVVEAQTGMQ